MNEKYPTVRRAVMQDYAAIWHLADLLHKENGLFEMSPRKMEWFLRRVIEPDKIPEGDMGLRGVMGVIGPIGGPIEGLIMLTIGSFWYSDDLVLEEYANYVHPAHRKSNHAKALLKYAQHMSDQIGIPLLIGVLSNKQTEAKVRLYRRVYGPEVGSYFIWNNKTGFGRPVTKDPAPG